jgi:iron complex outermembrane receptor protein
MAIRNKEKNRQRRLQRARNAYRKVGLILGGTALSMSALSAMAADDGTTQSSTEQSSVEQSAGSVRTEGGVPTVTVTATRREASLQSVPVAVSVISGEELTQSNRTSIDTIAAEIPSVTFRQQGGNKDSTIFVRGIGTISTSPGVEPTVATVIDGVVYARPGQATLDLLDVDHIEILRGPQGTLFGKNATSGVVNVVTRRPTEETTGYVDTSWYQGNEKQVRAGVSGTLVPNLVRASISSLYSDYAGNVTNVANGGNVNGYGKKGARAKVEITPNADLDITLIADYLKSRSSPTFTAYKSTSSSFSSAILPVVASADNRQVYNDIPSDIRDTNKGFSAQIDWRRNGYTLTSITAIREWDNTQYTTTSAIGNSSDASRISSTYPGTRDIGTVDFQQLSQEFRIASPKDQFIDYVAGAYFLHGKDSETYQRIVTTTGSVVNSGSAVYGVTSDSYALFGETNWNFTPAFRAIAGARWTHDELSYDHNRSSTSSSAFAGVSPAYGSSGSTSADGYSGRLGLQYDLSKQVSTYVTYSRGYKGPAYNVFFNMLARDTAALKPETSNSYEVGVKSQLLDKRLTVNAAIFKTDYDNYQANFYDVVNGTTITRLINAGRVSTQGVELDLEARPTGRLTLTQSLAYIDAHIVAFNCPSNATASCNLNGSTLPFSPHLKSYSRVNYAIPLASGHIVDLAGDYTWQSRTQYDLFQSQDAIQGAYGIFNASIALSSPSLDWRVALVVKNLTNKSYATNLVASTSGYVTRAVPRDDARYFGINLRKEF